MIKLICPSGAVRSSDLALRRPLLNGFTRLALRVAVVLASNDDRPIWVALSQRLDLPVRDSPCWLEFGITAAGRHRRHGQCSTRQTECRDAHHDEPPCDGREPLGPVWS